MNLITGNKVGNRVNVMINGTLHSKDCGDNETANAFFKQILQAKADPTDENIDKVYDFLNKNIRIARVGGFEFDPQTGNVYMEGFNTPVPDSIMETVEEYVENNFPIDSIKNFWKLLMANPDKRVREDLFKFIQTHDFSITDKGYMIVYKTVDYKNKVDVDLAEFVSETYFKIKDKWKEAPRNYVVYKELSEETVIEEVDNGYYELEGCDDEDGYYDEYGFEPDWIEEIEEQVITKLVAELKFTKQDTFDKWLVQGNKQIEYVGNVDGLMSTLAEIEDESKSTYTDKHTHTMEIKLGVPVRMERKDCDADPQKDCSYGLHVGSTKYVEKFRGVGLRNAKYDGESPVLVCLVNPMHVVAVPEYDHSKMRVSEYYPFGKGTVKNGQIEIIENPYFENDYIVHEEKELAQLIEANGENVRETAMNAEEDKREMDEYVKILKSRIIDLTV